MTPRERQQLLLAVLAVLVVAIVARSLAPVIRGPARSARAGDIQAGLVADHLLPLRVDLLDRNPGTYEPQRNIFRRGERPKPPPPPPPPPRPVVERSSTPPPPPPPRVPQPPTFGHLQLVGIFGPETRRIAVILSGESLFNLLEGDTLEEKFVIESIIGDEVELGFVGFPDAAPGRLRISGS